MSKFILCRKKPGGGWVEAFCGRSLSDPGSAFNHTLACEECSRYLLLNEVETVHRLWKKMGHLNRRYTLFKLAGYYQGKVPSGVAAPTEVSQIKALLGALSPFSLSNKAFPSCLPPFPGIYFVVVDSVNAAKLLYIGKTSRSFPVRFSDHHRLDEFLYIHRNVSPLTLYCLPVINSDDAAISAMEVDLIRRYKPSLNMQKVPEWCCSA